MRAFIEAIERSERLALAAQFALLVTASRGGNSEIKSLLRELKHETVADNFRPA